MMDPMSIDINRENLCTIVWDKLGDREVMVLLTIAVRLAEGQRIFGKLTANKRDWVKELMEEQLDSSLYSVFHLLDLQDKECQKNHQQKAPTGPEE